MPRKRKNFTMPIGAVIVLCVLLISASYHMSLDGTIGTKLAHISAVLAMPEGFSNEIKSLKKNIIGYFKPDNKITDIQQKSSSYNDSVETETLSSTPSDILKSMEKIQKLFNSGKYEYTGEVLEKTYIDYQATDSFDNIFVKNTTETKDIDIEEILNSEFSLPIDKIDEPAVLIYHTHTTETYIMTDNGKFSSDYSERSNDENVNMIRIGDEITRILKNNGIGVIHDTTIYDSVYTGAYSKSREGIEKILEKHPSIVITLDIHRDAIYYDSTTRIKQITKIGNDKAAQMMIIAGAEDGNITDFSSWETNLSFAVRLQKAANDKYKNLMKPILFCCRKYNMDITPYSLLIEVGTDMNSLKEAAYSGRLLGDVLADFIKQYAKGR